MPGESVLLLALTTPAVLINAVGGQNGCWTAALLGGGLSLLERRPYIAGGLFGLMVYKPHLALLLALSFLIFGPELWALYFRNLTALRHVVLEDDISPRMVSVFIAARSLGATASAAYWAQGIFGAFACLAVAVVWFKDTPAALKNAVLLLGTCLAIPYLQDYDLVFGAIVLAWLWQQPVESQRAERALQIACGLLLLLPLVAAALAQLTGLAFGPLFILPAFAVALHMSLGTRQETIAVPLPPTSQRFS